MQTCFNFRCINDERVLHYDPVKTCKFVVATTVIHNMAVLAGIPHFVDVEGARNNNVHGGLAGDEDDPIQPDPLVHGLEVRRRVVQWLEDRRNLVA